ncbi:MAG: gamma-glutamylcyclotransferase family protein [Streptosporangiaceae bacterium]
MSIYAAYAGNMDPALMARRCPHSPQHSTGWLDGWRLTFGGANLGWEGALPTVVEDPDHRVFVTLYEMTEPDAESLDQWDGAVLGYYRKSKVRVSTLDGDVVAWLYVLNDYEGGLPSARSVGMMADAAEAAGAPPDYAASLRARPCTSAGS